MNQVPMTPPTANVEASWSELEQLTAALRKTAADKEWSSVLELAARRHLNLLSHFEAFPVGPDNAAFYQHNLDRMLRGEQDLQRLVLDARRELMREGMNLQHNRKAVGAYINAHMG